MSRADNPALNFRAYADPRGGELTGEVVVGTANGGSVIPLSAAKDGLADLADVIHEIENPSEVEDDLATSEEEVEPAEEEEEEEKPKPKPKKPPAKKK